MARARKRGPIRGLRATLTIDSYRWISVTARRGLIMMVRPSPGGEVPGRLPAPLPPRLFYRDPKPVSIVLTVLNRISVSSQGEKYLT